MINNFKTFKYHFPPVPISFCYYFHYNSCHCRLYILNDGKCNHINCLQLRFLFLKYLVLFRIIRKITFQKLVDKKKRTDRKRNNYFHFLNLF